MDDLAGLPFGPGAICFLLMYVLILLGIGVWSSRQSESDTLADHVLAGRDMPTGVLILTLFATQYSGNSLFMNTSTAYT